MCEQGKGGLVNRRTLKQAIAKVKAEARRRVQMVEAAYLRVQELQSEGRFAVVSHTDPEFINLLDEGLHLHVTEVVTPQPRC